ncbi:MAG: hypothetical protein COY98_01400 [Candidatus Yonathbacteria bacterium CG_4_10_14_0_8_um_filter_43_17]|uniref:PKD domain-containing protein n=1 Tax=Candidatus Yonathbacteria bacterium CG_4_10_14_0_8_um_filter_43_17 TaxID=1975099 RepID=A0A2M7Q653_9BACT|nr:MAG: hypothetical protein COY98_01400 [Candidatus Yonathbacteria bacterium CG_4_10_14_0_8_um_filter_43_17]
MRLRGYADLRMKKIIFILILFFAQTVSATVIVNEVQISPINERFIELYNSDSSDVDLTGWYIQRKTATGSSFGSLVSSTQLNGKIIKANGYFLISRNSYSNSDIVTNITLTESNTIRVRDSKGKDVDQIEWGSIDAGKSYQRITAGEWVTALSTPGIANSVSQSVNAPIEINTNTASTQTTPQVTAQAGPQTRVVLAGAPIIFEGKIAGLENNFGRSVQTTWSFGDGASSVGESVLHTYYYPGEYTAVLDVVSGSLTATDKMLVRVVLPNLSLSSGGDNARSFFTIVNHGGDELDVSGWQVASNEKIFTFPKNTILGARKSAPFASEVTGLATPVGVIPELRFPNGTSVPIKVEAIASQDPTPILKTPEKTKVVASAETRVAPQAPQYQEASVLNAISDDTPAPPRQESGLWPWYVGSAFLGALALAGIRLTKNTEQKATINADDFEIIEETDDEEPH